MLGDLMLVLTRAGRVTEAGRILKKLDAEQTEIVGVPDVKVVQGLFDVALLSQKTPVCTVGGAEVASLSPDRGGGGQGGGDV